MDLGSQCFVWMTNECSQSSLASANSSACKLTDSFAQYVSLQSAEQNNNHTILGAGETSDVFRQAVQPADMAPIRGSTDSAANQTVQHNVK